MILTSLYPVRFGWGKNENIASGYSYLYLDGYCPRQTFIVCSRVVGRQVKYLALERSQRLGNANKTSVGKIKI